jgi:hypothetical protein
MALSEYKGEEIIDSIIISKGKKTLEKTWMPRTVFNDPKDKKAYIIGNGESRKGFDLYALPQDTYGCNALYRDYEPDFLVAVDQLMYKEIAESGYGEKNIVYTNRNNMKKYGGVCHLIPHNPHKGAGTSAMHLAVSDGHTELVCLGFDCDADGPNVNVYKDTPCYNSSTTVVHQTVWGRQILKFIQDNPKIKFVFVEGSQPREFEQLPNCGKITYAELNTHINQHGKKT